MLRRMDSKEVAWWIAFEQHSGPLGNRYSENRLADIIEALHALNYTMGALLASWGSGENEINKPQPVKRPHQMFEAALAADVSEPEQDPDYMPLEAFIQAFPKQ